jgi:hypothetical protein
VFVSATQAAVQLAQYIAADLYRVDTDIEYLRRRVYTSFQLHNHVTLVPGPEDLLNVQCRSAVSTLITVVTVVLAVENGLNLLYISARSPDLSVLRARTWGGEPTVDDRCTKSKPLDDGFTSSSRRSEGRNTVF